MFIQNKQGEMQSAFSPSDFASQQMGRVFLVSVYLAVKVSV